MTAHDPLSPSGSVSSYVVDGIADICFGFALYPAEPLVLRGGFKPNTTAYSQRLSTRPAFRKAITL